MTDSIHTAVRKRDVEAVKQILGVRRAAVLDRDADHSTTALHWAAKADDLVIAELLLHDGAEVDARDSSGRTPLDWVLLRDDRGHDGRRAMIELLLSHGATHTFETALRRGTPSHVEPWLAQRSISEPTAAGLSPLALAAESGGEAVVRFLLLRGANPNGEGFDLDTPLVHALRAGRLEVAELLLASGAHPETAGVSGITPLDEAVDARRYSARARPLGELLLAHGARPTPQWAAALDDVELLRTGLASWSIDRRDQSGRTGLAIAVELAHVRVVMDLLERGANPNIGDRQNVTPLHTAAAFRFMTEGTVSSEMVRALLAAGANPNAVDSNGRTPLHSALASLHSLGANLDVVRLLTDAGADPTVADSNGHSPAQQPGNLFIDVGEPDPQEVGDRYDATVAAVARILFG